MLYQQETSPERPPSAQDDNTNLRSSEKKRNRAPQVIVSDVDQVDSQKEDEYQSGIRLKVT